MSMAIDPSITLAELMTQRPALARELEDRALDYCCSGQRTLAEACEMRPFGRSVAGAGQLLAGAAFAIRPSS